VFCALGYGGTDRTPLLVSDDKGDLGLEALLLEMDESLPVLGMRPGRALQRDPTMLALLGNPQFVCFRPYRYV